jgi:hypothetical protein
MNTLKINWHHNTPSDQTEWIKLVLSGLAEGSRQVIFTHEDCDMLAGVLKDYLAPKALPTPPKGTGFYMVFAEGGYAPVKQHQHYATAEREAHRIARQQGHTTYVLEAIDKVVPTTTLAVTPLRVQPTNVVPFQHGPLTDNDPS